MIRRLLEAATNKDCSWLESANVVESTLKSEFTLLGLSRDLHYLILGYCPPLEEKLGLRVGSWANAQYGGEPRYIVSLASSQTRDSKLGTNRTEYKEERPMVEFPYEDLQACPAQEKPHFQKSAWVIRQNPDEGMRVLDDAASLRLDFPSGLIFFERHGYHVLPFEKINLRYQAIQHCGVSAARSATAWIFLCQLHNCFDIGSAASCCREYGRCVSNTSIGHELDLIVKPEISIQSAGPHVISQIIIRNRTDLLTASSNAE